MRQEYTTAVKEESTFKITCAWKNAAGTAVTPDSATWTLTDEAGTVINSRTAVSIASMATTNDIVLSGNDLAIQSATDNGKRIVTILAIYDSDEGTNLPLKDEYYFTIENLLNVT